MLKMLVGSCAMRLHFPDARIPNDIDMFSPWRINGVETFWHPAFSQYRKSEGFVIASPDELYTIKVSHSFWVIRNTWTKHMFDVTFLKNKGAKIIPEFYDILYPIWEERYGKKKAYLNAEPEEFFNSNIARVYEHDSLHHSIAYYETPMFERILKDNHPVMVDKSKFDALSYEDKLRLVREEVYATALERKIIPSDYTYSAKAAYTWALHKTITSFTKGWFPLFIVDNFNELRKPDIDYVAVHHVNKDRLVKL